MAGINLKTLVQKGAGFINMAALFKTLSLSPFRKNRVFFIFEGREYTYKETYEQSLLYAKLFSSVRKNKIAQGSLKPDGDLPIGVYMDNNPDYVFAFFGAALSSATIFGINTGFRGETLRNVINQAETALLLTDSTNLEAIENVIPETKSLEREDILLIETIEEAKALGYKSACEVLDDPEIKSGKLPKVKIDNMSPLIVIYTSGTTGAPKGVPCSHVKLVGAGFITWRRTGLTSKDRGYVCMPMFHSNAWYLGITPFLLAGGSFVLKRRFSASAFENDVLENGVTYMNYVGQPIHYILVALEKKYGSGEEVGKALAKHPKNKLRIAHGNGAPAVDRKKLVQYLGMEHVYELYGSTEASINAVVMPGDPIDCVGLLTSKKIVVLNENDEPCPPAILDEKGRITNYEEAVGEICKKTTVDNNLAFDGYYKNAEASTKKYRNGYYRSGDLGHVCIINGKRYLYFDGRTEDWIRKDGENFSAENVVQFVQTMPGVALATVYGAPCEVSDEKVMAAVKLKSNAKFDPKEAYNYFMRQQKEGGMDMKWMPDFIRIVEDFEMTHQTQKIVARTLKREHYNLEKVPDMEIFFRQRGDTQYRKLTDDEFEKLKKCFDETGRTNLLYVGL